jgi:hypothetical protein
VIQNSRSWGGGDVAGVPTQACSVVQFESW